MSARLRFLGDIVPGSKGNPFECGPCESFDFAQQKCVRTAESSSAPAEGCPSGLTWDPSLCLCVTSTGKPSETATTGVSALVVLGTIALGVVAGVLVAGAL